MRVDAELVNSANAAKEFGVVRHHEKIQWPVDLHASAVVGMDHRFAECVAIGSLRVSAEVAVQVRIRRVGAVHVGIAPQQYGLILCGAAC